MIHEVRDYYNNSPQWEEERLNNPYSNVEFETTKYLIDKYMVNKGNTIDIGCGTGKYSIDLLSKGYSVTLVDLSDKELEIAKANIDKNNLVAEDIICASATELDELPSESYDNVLVMGPLYHLQKVEERNKVLEDVKRILKPKGKALLSYINTIGVLRASVSEFPGSFEELKHFDRYKQDFISFDKEESFTFTFFAKPSFAINEVKNAGFNIITVAAAESFLAGLNVQLKNLYNNKRAIYNNYIEMAKQLCEDQAYREGSEHLTIIVEK